MNEVGVYAPFMERFLATLVDARDGRLPRQSPVKNEPASAGDVVLEDALLRRVNRIDSALSDCAWQIDESELPLAVVAGDSLVNLTCEEELSWQYSAWLPLLASQGRAVRGDFGLMWVPASDNSGVVTLYSWDETLECEREDLWRDSRLDEPAALAYARFLMAIRDGIVKVIEEDPLGGLGTRSEDSQHFVIIAVSDVDSLMESLLRALCEPLCPVVLLGDGAQARVQFSDIMTVDEWVAAYRSAVSAKSRSARVEWQESTPVLVFPEAL